MVSSTGSLGTEDWAGQGRQIESSAGTPPLSRKDRRKKKQARRRGEAPPSYYDMQSPTKGAGDYGGSSIPGSSPYQTTAMNAPTKGSGSGGTPGMGTSTGPLLHTVAPFDTASGPGQQTFASNPQLLFAQATGTQNAPGSFANQWYGSTYNPFDLAVALGGDTASDAAIVNFGAQLAQQFTGEAGLGVAMDPRYILSSLFNLAGKVQPGKSGGTTGPLAALAYQDPMTALSTFTSLLQGAVGGIIPKETFSALMQTIQGIGQEYIMQWANRPPEEEAQRGGGIIQFIASRLGPGFGL